VGALFREFLERNPTIDPDLDEDTWTWAQTEQSRQFTAAENKRFATEREQRATQLNVSATSPKFFALKIL